MPKAPKPPTIIELTWTRGLQFTVSASSPNSTISIDGDSREAPSPVHALAYAIATCMAVDVIHVLTKGRHAVTALRGRLVADRAQEDPHRFVRVRLDFVIETNAADDAVDRAIQLSRDTYCTVSNSIREDIDYEVTWQRA